MSEGVFVTADGCALAYERVGEGPPVVWQHGLGANRDQPAEVFPSDARVCRITMECRGHGHSDLGDPNQLSIARFTDDMCDFLDQQKIDKVVIGGISLGAAIALRLAALHPDRVLGLILARPAWVDGPSIETQAAYGEVAELLRTYGPVEGARRFEHSAKLAEVELVAPDNAKSLRWFFSRSRPETTIALLSRISKDFPGLTRSEISKIEAPTLIIVNGQDYVHPSAFGQELHAALPCATMRVVTSKSVDREAYVIEFKEAISAFLTDLEAWS